jgi:hypothetical protein
MPALSTFHEVNLSGAPIKSLGLTITGTSLEPILAQFASELQKAGLPRLRPRFYLSTEWGVPFGTVAIAIPFYLASPELTRVHAERVGHIEGNGPADILRYLRHEMGHVVNYAYRLYEREEWVKLFGSMNEPYEEDYRPQAFSPRFVENLPGWYAQKHPDEDWAETFAVWLSPDWDWRREYARRPIARAKLEYCDRTLHELADREPLATAEELDEDVADLAYSLEQFYRSLGASETPFPYDLDSGLRTIFGDQGSVAEVQRQPAAELIRRLEPRLMADVHCWTGHFPERTRVLLRHLAARAAELNLVYAENRAMDVAVNLTAFITALATNFVRHGSYIPEGRKQ